MTRYYKIIDNVKVIFTPPLIWNGIAWMRPTAERLEAAGWTAEEYTPPEPEPIPQGEPDEFSVLRGLKSLLLPQLEELTDEEALEVEECFPTWESKINQTLSIGERVWDDGHLYKVNQAHTASREWRPANTPALYTIVSIEEWPEWVQPTGAQDAYMTGDKVTFQGQHYISLIDNNTWSPSAYPAGWQLVTD